MAVPVAVGKCVMFNVDVGKGMIVKVEVRVRGAAFVLNVKSAMVVSTVVKDTLMARAR